MEILAIVIILTYLYILDRRIARLEGKIESLCQFLHFKFDKDEQN